VEKYLHPYVFMVGFLIKCWASFTFLTKTHTHTMSRMSVTKSATMSVNECHNCHSEGHKECQSEYHNVCQTRFTRSATMSVKVRATMCATDSTAICAKRVSN